VIRMGPLSWVAAQILPCRPGQDGTANAELPALGGAFLHARSRGTLHGVRISKTLDEVLRLCRYGDRAGDYVSSLALRIS